MTDGRAKGSVAEREVAGLVQAWWRQVEPDASFVRTPLSGGWGGPTLRKEFQASGDLMTTARDFPFAIEVKRREGWSKDRVIRGGSSPVWGWWRQCQKAADEMGKIPMLWFRKSRMPWLVMLPQSFELLAMPAALSWYPDDLKVDVGRHPVVLRERQVLWTSPREFVRMATGPLDFSSWAKLRRG